MPRRVEILNKQEVFHKFIFRIEEVQLRYERFHGKMSEALTRLNFNRGDSVAAVVHDRAADTVILVEQFRYPTYEKGPGWLIELPAGIVSDKENPQKTVQRELMEEVGYEAKKVQHISTFYVSPGGTSERIHLYYASVVPKDQTSTGGGLAPEGEDIHVLSLKVSDALAKVASGEIADAKTIIGLQWLQLHAKG